MTQLCLLTRYDDTGASSRMRFEQYRKPLSRLLPQWRIGRQSLLDGRYLQHKYAGAGTTIDVLRCYVARARALHSLGNDGIWWLEKELWPWAPAWLERRLLARQPFVIDLDDAVFHNYDRHPLGAVRTLYRRKIDRLMAAARLVTVGNEYLAQRARDAGARWVELLPTVIDLDRYPAPQRSRRVATALCESSGSARRRQRLTLKSSRGRCDGSPTSAAFAWWPSARVR